MSFIQFFFQNGEFISNPSNFLFDIFKSIIGPVISFGAAIYIFYRTRRADKKKETEQKIQQRTDNLKYFQSLFKKCNGVAGSMITNFKKCTETNALDSYKFEGNNKTTLNDFDRLVNKIDQQVYYHAYIGRFTAINSVDEFIKLYTYMDFFFLNITVIESIISDRVSECFKEKLMYRDIIDEAIIPLLQFTEIPAYVISHAELIEEIKKLLIGIEKINKENIQEYEEKFVRPLLMLIMNDSKTIPSLQSAFFTYIKARKIASLIVFNNKVAIEKVNNKITVFDKEYKKFNAETVSFRDLKL